MGFCHAFKVQDTADIEIDWTSKNPKIAMFGGIGVALFVIIVTVFAFMNPEEKKNKVSLFGSRERIEGGIRFGV